MSDMEKVTYEQAQQYILDIPKFAGKHTLTDTGRMLAALDAFNQNTKIIHVAGTNGKGSVCAYLQSILMAEGFRVGMFISPHLETMRERIRINKELIPESDFVRSFERVREESIREKENHPSFFEFLFLMAMCYFAEQKPDYIILETGLGGRLDATNCMERPALCVITEIGYDHMQYLGDTITQIAGEKAGIIKRGVPVVYMDRRKEASEVIGAEARRQEAFAVPVKKSQIRNMTMRKKNIDFSFCNEYYRYDSLTICTTASYQAENASLALVAAKTLLGETLTNEGIRQGLLHAFWPARMEEILPRVFLDGAHNEDGIEAFLASVAAAKDDEKTASGRSFLLFGVVADKQYEQMIGQIAASGLFSHIAVTTLSSDRSASIDKLRAAWQPYENTSCSFYESVREAFLEMRSLQGKEDTLYIAGSLYLAGQIKTIVRRTPDD